MRKAKALALGLLILSPFISLAQTIAENLRCVDKINPAGVHEPYFGWYMNDPDDNEVQTAYQILVATSPTKLTEAEADVWNSEKVESGTQNYVYYNGPALASATRYHWTVRIWDKDGNASELASATYFDTGLLENAAWSGAKWIKKELTFNDQYTYFRKTFELASKPVKRAMVYASAVHEFDLFLNGELVGKGPGYHYPEYQYYQAFDITGLLDSEQQQLFACHTHWYHSGQGRPESAPGFILKAIIEFEDGTEMIVGTDASWKQIRASLYNPNRQQRNGEGVGRIERLDYRNEIPGWNLRAYDDSSWEGAMEIGEHPVAPWVNMLQPNFAHVLEEEITPISSTIVGEDRYIVDLGKVYSGYPKVQISGGEEGTEVAVMGGFTLAGNGIDRATQQNTDMRYSFYITGGTQVFQPYTYLGMRYFQVARSPLELTPDNAKFVTRHFELDPSRSDFHSSYETLNRVYEVMKHSLIIGAQESFVDTPTREKGGFLGDSWSIGVASMVNMGDRVLNRRILEEFLDSQEQHWPDGRLNAVYPNGDGARDIPDYTQMFLVWVWDYYMQTGDVGFLKQHFDRLKNVADYVDNHIDMGTGLVKDLTGGGGPYEYGIIDWPETMRYGYDMTTDMRTVINAYAYIDFDIIARIAEELDSTSIANEYRSKASAVKSAMNDLLINDEGKFVDGLLGGTPSQHVSQHANMFPYAMGIAPEENADSIIAEIKRQKMSCGMVALRWLPEALGLADEGKHLFELYTNKSWDGWANNIARGATTTWESWDALETGNSLSHPWGAVGLIGLQEYFLGVKVLKPQHEEIQIKPLDFGYAMTMEGRVPSDRGDIEVSWARADSSFSMTVNVPDNVQAHVYVPKTEVASKTVTVNLTDMEGEEIGNYLYLGVFGSGTHNFERETSLATPPAEPEPDQEQVVLVPWEPEPEPELDNDQPSHFKLYPNPVNDKTLIDLGAEYRKAKIQIQDMTGKTLFSATNRNSSIYQLNLENYESGVYLIQIETPEYQETVKLVKE